VDEKALERERAQQVLDRYTRDSGIDGTTNRF
jgi:hypothetical protein